MSIFQIISIGLFGFIFGTFEATTNLFYLLTRNYDLPRKQHSKELPINVTDDEVLHKVFQMFVLGVWLLFIAVVSIMIAPQLFIVGAAAILVSGLIDYSRFRKFDMLVIWIVMAVIISTFSLLTID